MASPRHSQWGGPCATRAPGAFTPTFIAIEDSIVRPKSASSSNALSRNRPHDESWVEIASQPSSSSISSTGEDIVATGLRMDHLCYPPRRRRLQHHYHQSVRQRDMPQSYLVNHAATQPVSTSSQEEYDETESEEDRLITSSTENMDSRPRLQRSQTAVGSGPSTSDLEDEGDDDDDDDDNDVDIDNDETALGTWSTQSFRPRPNAFSHPPVRSYPTTSAIPSHHPRSTPASRLHTRSPLDYRSPLYQADRDEALRASLTTLLSCAAAAKSLPRKRGTNMAASSSSGEPVLGAGVGPSPQPMDLRLVPESALGNTASPPFDPPATTLSRRLQATGRTSSKSSGQSGPILQPSREERGKRTAAVGQFRPQRATKKKKISAAASLVETDTSVTWIRPAYLTWVLGTGVVLLVSVVGFGAGFVVGREIGRQDVLISSSGGSGAAVSAASNSTPCGSEFVRRTGTGTLKRWRWGSGIGRSVIA